MELENLVMKVVNSLKKNDLYREHISSLENFVKTKEIDPSLTEEQTISLSKAKSQIEALKTIVSNHEIEIDKLIRDHNLEPVMEVAKILKNDFKI